MDTRGGKLTTGDKEIKFTVFPFFKMKVDDDDARKTKESYFIQKFKPLLNSN